MSAGHAARASGVRKRSSGAGSAGLGVVEASLVAVVAVGALGAGAALVIAPPFAASVPTALARQPQSAATTSAIANGCMDGGLTGAAGTLRNEWNAAQVRSTMPVGAPLERRANVEPSSDDPSAAPEAGLSTRAVHAGEPRVATGPLDAPLVLSSAFAFADAETAAAAFRGENDAHIYGRWGTPTVEALEAKVAALEGGEAAVATASGMAAISGALLTLCRAGDHVVAPRALYGETARLLRERLPRYGIEATFVDGTSIDAYAAAIRPGTRVLYAETPANPVLAVTDLPALAALARDRGLVCVADNTFATPACQRPIALGAHVVVHSMTKALAGHGDAIGGVIVSSAALRERFADTVVKGLGAVLSPFNAFLVARGARTLGLRMDRAASTALTLARWLEARPGVARVHYPGLPSHPGHAIAARQMRAFGSIVAFELDGGLAAGAELLGRVRLIAHAVSLGDVRSLVTHPASTTASTMPREDRRAAGISDGLLRLSVGIEDADDLVADLDRAIGRA
jgi:cystathionine beta-lyase/cystathionine gamma-synthase